MDNQRESILLLENLRKEEMAAGSDCSQLFRHMSRCDLLSRKLENVFKCRQHIRAIPSSFINHILSPSSSHFLLDSTTLGYTVDLG